MRTTKLKEGIYSIGVLNPDLRVFDIIMRTDYGTTYNAYLVKGEKAAIIENVKTNFTDEFICNIKELVDIKDIEYIILNHTEPDHSGSLKHLLDVIPHAKVVTSKAGHQYIKQIINREFEFQIANDGDEIDLGGKKLKFINAPFLHWPDSMFTYCETDSVLFPCDAFGTHFCEETQLKSQITDKAGYDRMFSYYFGVIMSPFREFVLKAIDKIRNLKIDMICPSHGPILDVDPWYSVNKYEEWAKTILDKNDPQKVLICYVSAYGCTTALARRIADGAASLGLSADVIDVERADLMAVRENIEQADGLIFGSPTINKDAVKPIWDAIAMIDAIKNKGKLSAAFGSYGWSGEGVKLMEERLKGLRMNLVEPGPRALFVPSEKELDAAYEFGRSFAQKLLEK